jgi:hypothetical protein
MQVELKGLPKISLNQWYAGGHWTKRTKIKSDYIYIIKSQFKGQFKKDKQYEVEYRFCFKNNPLDASNCVAMVKLIEDIIFEDDKHDIIKSIKISSEKGKDDLVQIEIIEKII